LPISTGNGSCDDERSSAAKWVIISVEGNQGQALKNGEKRSIIMAEERNVLIVTNSAADSEIRQISNAFAKAQTEDILLRLRLVHVIPDLPACYFNIPSMVQLAERYYAEATDILTRIGKILLVPKSDQWLITGKIRHEVLRLAAQLETHFILAGSNCISDLHQSILAAGRMSRPTPVRSISSFASI
jgi:hypothetical protein